MTPPHGVEATPCAALKPETLYSSVAGLNLPQRRKVITNDMAGHFVKMDSVVEFLDAFLPYPSTAPKRKPLKENPFESLVGADKLLEAEVVELFTKAVKSKNLCPNMVLATSQHTPDPKGVDKTQQKVDAAFFHTKDAPRNGRPGWPLDVIPAEFKNRKYGDIYDPLNDKAKDSEFESKADTRGEVRGQLTTYSELIHELQHRIFLIMLLVIGRRYRLMRWDRAGTVVTPSIDYYENPDDLCEFLWRISHLDDEALGLDPTAIRLKGDAFDELDAIALSVDSDVDHMPRVLKARELTGKFCYRYVREMFAASIRDRAVPRYKLHIRTGDSMHTFLVGKPAAVTCGMIGRGTRGWVAWHCEGRCFVWLKDAWRVAFEDIEREGDILARLNHAKISNVPTLVCHGDIGNQTTLTADWWKRKKCQTTSPVVLTLSSADEPSDRANDGSCKRKRPHEDECHDTSSKRPQPVAHSQLRRGPHRACKSTEKTENKSRPTGCEKQPAGDAEPTQVENKLTQLPVYTQGCPIKCHAHYRMVVAEVGMPLKEFMSGRQLASVLLDCIIAHYNAATSRSLGVRILHRDISDKNILIYPKVIKSDKGTRYLNWSGILADWEISKPIPRLGVEDGARQPERTGRWQFMSAKLLMDFRQRVMIEDELESFLYILIYYAVRYLKSNLVTDDDAAHFLEACFDCFTVHNDKAICGYQKLTLVSHGDSAEIIFHHSIKALNEFITAVIPCFRARYKVLAWNEWVKVLSKDHPAHPQCRDRYKTPPPNSGGARELHDATSTRDMDDTELDDEMPPSPTKDDRTIAMRLANHRFIKAKLRSALEHGKWRDDDRVPDRVPSDYTSHYPLLSTIPEPAKSNGPPAPTVSGSG